MYMFHDTLMKDSGQLAGVSFLLLGIELRESGLHHKHFYPVSHLAGPILLFFNIKKIIMTTQAC